MNMETLENSLKDQMYKLFVECGFEKGCWVIQDSILDVDSATEVQKRNFLIATAEGEKSIFDKALRRAYDLSVNHLKEFDEKNIEYLELMDTIKFVRTQIH